MPPTPKRLVEALGSHLWSESVPMAAFTWRRNTMADQASETRKLFWKGCGIVLFNHTLAEATSSLCWSPMAPKHYLEILTNSEGSIKGALVGLP